MTRDLITVPRLTASALVAQAKAKLGLTYCSADLAAWEFAAEEGGKTFEVLKYRPGPVKSGKEVRAFLAAGGFRGSVAAFMAWVTEKKPDDFLVSVPDDDRLWIDPRSRSLFVPYFGLSDLNCELGLLAMESAGDDWTFVAFRELPSIT